MNVDAPRKAVLPLVFILAFSASVAEDRLLRSEFFCELDPYTGAGSEYPVSRETAAKILLEEARFVFSGMTYGFSFEYVPSDKTREVKEIFDFSPLGEIAWGDPGLRVTEMRVDGSRLKAWIEYGPDPSGIRSISFWESSIFVPAQGSGTGNIFLGLGERRSSIREAVKNAIREYARTREANKPKSIRGSCVFERAPRTIISQGAYLSTVRIRLEIKEVLPYLFF